MLVSLLPEGPCPLEEGIPVNQSRRSKPRYLWVMWLCPLCSRRHMGNEHHHVFCRRLLTLVCSAGAHPSSPQHRKCQEEHGDPVLQDLPCNPQMSHHCSLQPTCSVAFVSCLSYVALCYDFRVCLGIVNL